MLQCLYVLVIFKSFPQIWECMFGQIFEKLLENQFYDEAETCLSHMMRSVFWMLFPPTRCRWIWPKINAVASRPAPDSWKKGTVVRFLQVHKFQFSCCNLHSLTSFKMPFQWNSQAEKAAFQLQGQVRHCSSTCPHWIPRDLELCSHRGPLMTSGYILFTGNYLQQIRTIMGGQGAANRPGSIKRVEVRVRGGGTMVPSSMQNTSQNLGSPYPSYCYSRPI